MVYLEDYANAYAFDSTIFNRNATELYNAASLYLVRCKPDELTW